MGEATGASGPWGLRSGCRKPQGAHHPAPGLGRAGAQMAMGPVITMACAPRVGGWALGWRGPPRGAAFRRAGRQLPLSGIKILALICVRPEFAAALIYIDPWLRLCTPGGRDLQIIIIARGLAAKAPGRPPPSIRDALWSAWMAVVCMLVGCRS